MEPYCSGEDSAFDVPSLADKVIRGSGMCNGFNILMNDRTLIEIGCNIMSCCSNHLYSAGMCLMIRLSAFETRKKAVVDVNAATS